MQGRFWYISEICVNLVLIIVSCGVTVAHQILTLIVVVRIHAGKLIYTSLTQYIFL